MGFRILGNLRTDYTRNLHPKIYGTPLSHNDGILLDGEGVRYAPVTELDISYIGFRECRDGIKFGSPDPNKVYSVAPTLNDPGDRGISMFKLIRSDHFISDEYHRTQWSQLLCRIPYSKPTGIPVWKKFLCQRGGPTCLLLHKLRALSKHNRTKKEKDNNILHKFFVVTWDSQLKEVAKSSHRIAES
ncbi:unnamed protein product [Clonostachys chloroleuca]|uniref:Uncharacterized protein n=1 Tax=Clonostachys chloroleuca TaxID=1926264 RepID=A0AA35Q3F7_9HYPO|nr:unnamed protein product [Clonostachys chloroleuca]